MLYFIEKAGFFPELLKRFFQSLPFIRVMVGQMGEMHRDVVAYGVRRRARRVVCSAGLETDGRAGVGSCTSVTMKPWPGKYLSELLDSFQILIRGLQGALCSEPLRPVF